MNERSRAPDSASDRALALVTVAACAVTLCAMFWPAASRRVFVYGDLGSFLLPMRIFLAQSLEHGITPLWMPNLFCGYYAHGEGPIGIFHPLRWLLYRLLPISEAYNLECLIPYPFALVGMTLFLRRLALPASAALFGGLSFAFCPYLTVRLTHVNSVAVIAHLGWLLLAIDVVLRESGTARRRAWLGIALVTGSQLLIGYPIAIVYCWLIAIPYTLFVAGSRREVWPALAVAAGLGAGFLLGGIQLVPTWAYWTTSDRVAPSYGFLTDQSLNPWNLLIAIAPWLLRGRLYTDGEFNPVEQVLYFGPVVPIAVSWVLLRWRQLGRLRPLVAGLLALSGVALLLALGKHTGLYRWVVELPVVGLLRVPARFSIVLYFAGALLAAIAFADLQRGDPTLARRRIWSVWIVPAASWLVAAIALALGEPIADYPARVASELAPLHLVVLGPLALTFAAALFTAAERGRRAALFGLVVLALADHAAYGATLWWYDPPQSLADYRARIERPPALPPERVATWKTFQIFGVDAWRWSGWASTSFIVHDVRLVTGYAGLQPAKRLDYTKPVSLRLAGATTNLARFRLEDSPGAPGGGARVVNVYERRSGALARARLVAHAMRSAQPAIDIEKIDVENTALVDEPLDLEAGPAGAAAIQEDQPGAIRIAVDAPTRQLLVLAESFDPGWRVAVDGTPARALRVNGDFLGGRRAGRACRGLPLRPAQLHGRVVEQRRGTRHRAGGRARGADSRAVSQRSGAPQSASDRALLLTMVAACAVTLCAMFWPAASRRVFVYGDLGSFLLPMRFFLAQSLERGITPLWMPNLFCGYYAHGEGPIGIFHPLRWLLYRLLPISEAFNLECLIPYPFALAGMTLFLRRLALPPSAALFGGISFAFSAYMTSRLTHTNAIAVIAHVGWLLLAIDVAIREMGRRRRRAWLAIALVTASQLLVGYPVAIVYCWLLAIPYALFAAASRRQLRRLPAVAAALATGALIAGIQVVPTWDHLAGSQRAQPTYDYLTAQSLHPWNLLTVVAPWLFGLRLYSDGEQNPIEQTLYLGPVVPIAVTWVLLRWRQLARPRALVGGLLAMSTAALALALGKHTGLYRWVVELPMIGLLRVPARYSIVLYFAGALFAAIAFADLQRGDPSPERRRSVWWIWIVPAASWLVAGLAFALRDPSWGQPGFADQQNSAAMVVLGPLVFTLAAALFTAAVRGHRAALFGLVALALADHAVYGATLWWYDPPQTLADYRAGIPAPPAVAPQRVACLADWGFTSSADRPWHWSSSTQWIVHDARLVSGYAGLMPARRLDYAKSASLRVAGASVLARGRFWRLPGALPRARMVSSALRSAHPAVDIETIDVEQTALVDEPVALEVGPAGTAAIQEDLPGAIRIAVEAPTRQLLVLAESFHPGWRALIDGAAARVLRVNGDFMGVIVEPGDHAVSFSFAPRSFAVGRWTSLAGMAIVLAVAVAGLTPVVPRRP